MSNAEWAFLEAACVPRNADHSSGTLQQASALLAQSPDLARSDIFCAAALADVSALQSFLAHHPSNATAKGGPFDWDALTYLCFSRFLRLDRSRSDAFVKAATLLLEAGASAETDWYEVPNHPGGERIRESALYGAAGIAHHPGLTRLLIEFGADPNDGETPYHAPEGYDNAVVEVLLESGRLNEDSLACMMIRKADWHDLDGMRLVLEHGAKPDQAWSGIRVLSHAIRRDNSFAMFELLVQHGADLQSVASLAARYGRGDVLDLLDRTHLLAHLDGSDRILASCAQGNVPHVEPLALQDISPSAGTHLTRFAISGNAPGLSCLLSLGINPAAPFTEGDEYWDLTPASTALHAAAWRAWPQAVKVLVEHGAPVNVLDQKGRSPLALAAKACTDSYWTNRRSPESIEVLLAAGADTESVTDLDRLLEDLRS